MFLPNDVVSIQLWKVLRFLCVFRETERLRVSITTGQLTNSMRCTISVTTHDILIFLVLQALLQIHYLEDFLASASHRARKVLQSTEESRKQGWQTLRLLRLRIWKVSKETRR